MRNVLDAAAEGGTRSPPCSTDKTSLRGIGFRHFDVELTIVAAIIWMSICVGIDEPTGVTSFCCQNPQQLGLQLQRHLATSSRKHDTARGSAKHTETAAPRR